jgi:hypothetical protein
MERLIKCQSDSELTQDLHFLLAWSARERQVAEANPPGPIRQAAVNQIRRLSREVDRIILLRSLHGVSIRPSAATAHTSFGQPGSVTRAFSSRHARS